MMITPFSESTFNFSQISDLVSKSENLLEKIFPAFKELSPKICIGLIQGCTVHILSIKELDPINL